MSTFIEASTFVVLTALVGVHYIRVAIGLNAWRRGCN